MFRCRSRNFVYSGVSIDRAEPNTSQAATPALANSKDTLLRSSDGSKTGSTRTGTLNPTRSRRQSNQSGPRIRRGSGALSPSRTRSRGVPFPSRPNKKRRPHAVPLNEQVSPPIHQKVRRRAASMV